MGTKTISLGTETYEMLKRIKRKDKSFTDVVKRLTQRRSLLELSELVSKEEAVALRKNIEKGSRERKEIRKRELGIEQSGAHQYDLPDRPHG